jgi:Holliday junction resolvase
MSNSGQLLELRVKEELEDITKSCKLTAGSGAFHDDGDVITEGPGLLIECKFRNKSNIILDHKVMQKVSRQAARTGKDWIIVSENSEGEIVASMDLSTLTFLLDLAKEK